MVDRDRLNSAPLGAVAKACVQLFDRVKDLPKEVQLLALASTFVIMSKVLRFPTEDTYQAVTNLMRDPTHSERIDHRFAAMQYLMETELLGKVEVHNG